MSRWTEQAIKTDVVGKPLAIDLSCTHVCFEIFLPDTLVKHNIPPLLLNQIFRENILYTLRIINFLSFHGFIDT